MIEKLLQPEIQQFIRDNEFVNPGDLMLKLSKNREWPAKDIVEQIQARRKAKTKLPLYYKNRQIVYPSGISMEQSSSQRTAQYKASLIKGDTTIDLTGGFGVDTYFLASSFRHAHYVERSDYLVNLARHNFKALGGLGIQVHHEQASTFLDSLSESVDLIYLDPARRSSENKKLILLKDCEPDLLNLLPRLLAKTRNLLIKTSPLLDITGAINDLGGATKVHVLSDNNEVKELVFQIDNSANDNPAICCINFKGDVTEEFEFDFIQERASTPELSKTSQFLYEPNASILKAGAFKLLAKVFGLKKLHKNTHLYTAEHRNSSFPGRVFRVIDQLTMNKKVLRKRIPEMKANISVRNFPMSVEEIRKKTGIKEGGKAYVLAATDKEGPKMLLCERI